MAAAFNIGAATGVGANHPIIAAKAIVGACGGWDQWPRGPLDSAGVLPVRSVTAGSQSASRYRASGLSHLSVSDCIRAVRAVVESPYRGMNAPWIDRHGSRDTFAVRPCHVEPLKTTSDPAAPQASTCSSCSARTSDLESRGSRDQRCEPGTKRVTPLSGRKASIIRMKPSALSIAIATFQICCVLASLGPTRLGRRFDGEEVCRPTQRRGAQDL